MPTALLFLALLSLLPSPRTPESSPGTRSAPDSPVFSTADSVLYGRLADGVDYRWIRRPSGTVIHVLSLDVAQGVHVDLVKAGGRHGATATLSDIFARAEREYRLEGDTLLAAVNAGTWDPMKLAPVGPLVVDGEVVELVSDDEWSAFTLYADGRGGISRDQLTGEILWRRRRVPIVEVNRRSCDGCAVLYNRFYGPRVPDLSARTEADLIADALRYAVVDDPGIDGVELIDTARLAGRIRSLAMKSHGERSELKYSIRRIQSPEFGWYGAPRVNDTVWAIVTGIDTGVVDVPDNGYVFSPGSASDALAPLRRGDTVAIYFQVARVDGNELHDVVPGHPQLLLGGVAVQEPEPAQGPAANQRPSERQARTAVGLTSSRDTILLVAVEAPDGGRGGATIDELASLMSELGARDAIAFEGIGPSAMVINGEVVTHAPRGLQEHPSAGALVVVRRRP